MENRRPPLNLAGKRSGSLVAVKDVGVGKFGGRVWLCKCDCGGKIEVNAAEFKKKRNCGCGLLKFDRDRIDLKPGRTYEEFILKKNEDVEYSVICEYLGIGFFEAREIYDGISGLGIDDIGTFKQARLMSAKPKKTKLEYIKTGEDWRESRGGAR